MQQQNLKASLRKLTKITLLLALVCLQACVHPLPNVPLYQDLGDSGYEVHSMPGKPEREVAGQEWQDIKDRSFIVPYESWGEIKKFILKVCKDYGKCTEEEVPQVEAHIKELDTKIEQRLF